MNFLIEGPDGSGKTTLAKNISQLYGHEIIHNSYPKTIDEGKNMKQYYIDLMKRDNIVIDRGWWSEFVYGTVVRNNTWLSTIDVNELTEIFLNNGHMVIYCTGNVDELWDRCILRGEKYVKNFKTYQQIHTLYDSMYDYFNKHYDIERVVIK